MLTKVKRREIIRDTPRINPETDWQCNPTPEYITNQMCSLVGKDDYHYLVFFDLMFVETLFEDFDVKPKHITLVTDRAFEGEIAKIMYGKINYVVFPKENLYNNIIVEKNKPTYFSREFIKELNMPKTDKLVIFGNPPYQEMTGSRQGRAIYHEFIQSCFKLSPRYVSMIIPSRWMQSGMAKGLDAFREEMMHSGKVKSIKHYTGTNSVFGKNANIAGGVNYFLWDSMHNGACNINGVEIDLTPYDIIVPDTNSFSIIEKSRSYNVPMSNCVLPIQPFKGLGTNFHKNWKESGIKCYASHGRTGFVSNEDFEDNGNVLGKYKVCITEATSARSVEDEYGTRSVLTGFLLLAPNEVCTQTWLIVNTFDDKESAENFISYAKTKVFRFLLGTRLMVNYHTSKDSFSFVPDLQDYTHPWDDKQVCEKIGITDEEFKYIDSKIRDWKETDIEEKETEEE